MTGRNGMTTAAAAVALAGLLGGGTAYAATQLTGPGHSSSVRQGGMAMDGMHMGSFTEDLPFDAQFLDQMAVHHEGAIMSTEAMIADSARPELRDLAQDILANQTAELEQMRTWRAEWYPELPPTFTMGGRSMMGGGSMMDGGSMMGGSGADRMYLQMMLVHHQLAVDMAERAQRQATHPQLRELAEAMAQHQAAEIGRMRGYLTGLLGDTEN